MESLFSGGGTYLGETMRHGDALLLSTCRMKTLLYQLLFIFTLLGFHTCTFTFLTLHPLLPESINPQHFPYTICLRFTHPQSSLPFFDRTPCLPEKYDIKNDSYFTSITKMPGLACL